MKLANVKGSLPFGENRSQAFNSDYDYNGEQMAAAVALKAFLCRQTK